MAKITERIALQEFSYLEIEADSLEELLEVSEAAKQAYADKLHVAPESIKVHSESQDKEYPTRLARQAAESFGKASKQYTTFEDGLGMTDNVLCEKCGTPMVMQTKTSKKTGKPYTGYFCPKSTPQDSHPIQFPKRY